jgi:predicted small lipoprotein YifL
MNLRPACLVLIAASTLLLGACGSKGPLMLPGAVPAKAARPVAVPPAQTAPVQATDDHNSTPTPSAPQ